MARNWTSAQIAAMDTRNKTLLVSAAAGSGKTATLTERIIRRITDKNDPADISKMLIVTFTRAAAAELRSRIFGALSDALASDPSSKHLASQLMKIGSARICTIDSFYLDIIKSNFSYLDLPAGFRTADDSEYELIARASMEESIEYMYDTCDAFPLLVECFGNVRSSDKIADIFLQLHDDLCSFPEGIEYVKKCAQKAQAESYLDFFSTSYGITVRDTVKSFCEHYINIFRSAIAYMDIDTYMSEAYKDSFLYDLEYSQNLYDALCDDTYGYAFAKNIIESYAPVALKRLSKANKTDKAQLYQNLRSAFGTKIKTLGKSTFAKQEEVIARAMKDTSAHLSTLYELLQRFEAIIQEEKDLRSILTFSDIRRYTLKLLVDDNGEPTEIAKKYAEQFTDIYIDEYQDVDRVQDLIFRSIAKPDNRFMVGDIKQSIYGFRGAEPMLFASYRKEFPPLDSDEALNSDSATIFMSNNFRCDESVINFTNVVCSTIFSACADSIGYTKDDDLVYSKLPPHDDYVPKKVRVSIVTPPNEELPEDFDDSSEARKYWEAEYIAKEILRLVREEKKADDSPIRPSDIAILFRSKSMSSILSDVLAAHNISCAENDAERYFEDPDVLMMLCILNTIDNPQRDIYLAGALRSPIFNFSLDEIISIRQSADKRFSLFEALRKYADSFDDSLSQKVRAFLQDIEGWQNDAASLSVDRFLRMLFDSPRFVASGVVSQSNGNNKGGNLLILYEYARKFESGSFKGLYQFVEYINSIIEDVGKLPNEGQASSDDRVSLMTVHKSKGLEFPVCFICNCAASARSRDNKNSMVYEYSSGIALKIADGSGFARINNPMRDAVLSHISDKQMEEEMRILYVALTRARERLYVTATTADDPQKLIAKAKTNATLIDRYTVMNSCTSYLDWILLAMQGAENSSFDLKFIPHQISLANEYPQEDDSEKITEIDEKLAERLKNEFSFKYDYAPLSRIPSKLSVSRLYPDILDENDTSLELFAKSESKTLVPDILLGKKSTPTGAERGTATHLFLQFCDFERLSRYGVKEELSRLEEKRFLPNNARSLIYLDELESFAKSSLIGDILNAKQIFREQRFNVELPASDFSSNETLSDKIKNEYLAVQGVIDLIIVDENGNVSLIDYKTDRLSREELSDDELAAKKINELHASQLSYYKKAVELLFCRECSRVCVYSTHSAKLYEIKVQ